MQPDAHFQIINCQCIESSDPFIRSLCDGPVDASLIDRLHRFGQTTPLLVWQRSEKIFQLLADYPTMQAITSLGIEHVLCRVLPLSAPPTLRYSLQILHGLSGLLASPILHAHLLQQARQELTEDELFDLMRLMGYKPQRYELDELIALMHLSPAALRALHRGILAPRTGKLLKSLSHDDQTILVRLLDAYRPGGSKQFKLIEMVTELFLRDNKSVRELLRKWLPTEHERVRDNTPQRLQKILQSLAELYWPEKTKMEKRFQQLVDELHPPMGVVLAPSPSFEDESVEVRLRFANSEVLRKKWATLKTVIAP